MSRSKSPIFKDIDATADHIARAMLHTHKLLEAGAESGSHLPITSLLIVAGAACAHASDLAETIRANIVAEQISG